MSLPPALALGTFYEGVMQAALRQFFSRATLEIEPAGTTPPSLDQPLTIEPSSDPSTLTICWVGTRYKLHAVGRWGFTPHEIQIARAIGAVISARYRAILNPQLAAERGELFRGQIEDRFVGAFLDERPYAQGGHEHTVDRIASVIELLRVAALSSYENRPISTGVLMLGGAHDPCRSELTARETVPAYMESLTSIKSFYRLADGVRTVFLADADGRLLDMIDIDRWSRQLCPDAILDVPGVQAYHAHARATLEQRSVCIVLSPSRREILHLLEGRSAIELDPSVLSTLASLDGAIVVDREARLLAAGAILRHRPSADLEPGDIVEGARTTAAMAASRFGPVLKISEDGMITFYDRERVWDI